MNIRSILLLVVALLLPLTAGAAPRHRLRTIEQAVEMSDFTVLLDAEKRGVVTAKPCDQCAPVTLYVDANTILKRGDEVLPLETLNEAPLQFATLFYLPESGRVTRITLQR
jgi:hypothetical protein